MRVRPAAVAGTFYPADPQVLRREVEAALAAAAAAVPQERRAPPPKAVVAPHAGYAYSGPVAASAYAAVAAGGPRGRVARVVLLGPAHRAHLRAVAAPAADAFATPLGPVRVDAEARDALVASGRVVVADAAHADEHGLEVHLPFLQVVLGGDVAVLPLVVGEVGPLEVADVLERVWGGPETLVVVSTDLSHYHDHDAAVALDRETAAAVVARRPGAVGTRAACGAFPLRGLLVVARRKDLAVELLDLRTSADTAGGPDRVVGYGAFALA